VISDDEGAASGDDEGRSFGANAFDGHLWVCFQCRLEGVEVGLA
jgi:hypothetical protein